MREPLPIANDQPYDRPHQPWICGRTAQGDPCAFGPGPQGRCPNRAECTPLAVNGVWQCNRPAVRGGPCPDGPLPDGKCCRHHQCRPARSLRLVRGKLSRAVLLGGIGMLLLLLGSDWRWGFIAPGPLCKSHAQILRGVPSQQRCATCHAAAETEPTTWLATALGGPQVGPTQSERCMVCHQSSIAPQHALAPHNVPATLLASHHGSEGPTSKAPATIACSVCHQEHQGTDHPLSAMDNTRCQACHQQQFTSFASDHPSLGIWPYERRTPIAFNHASHAGKHFAAKGESFDCATCHFSDSTGSVQLTRPYEQSCAECHDGPIEASLAGGVPLFQLPMIDTEALREAGEQVGAWPESLVGDFDGALPAPMKLMLAHDPEWPQIVATLGADFQLGDVDPDDPEQVRAAAKVVRALKRQWWRIEQGELPEAAAVGLTPELLRDAQQAWLPQLASEMGGQAESVSSLDAATRNHSITRDDATMSLVVHARGHADPFLRAWLDHAAKQPDQTLRKLTMAEIAGPTSPGLCATCHSLEQTVPSLAEWSDNDLTQAPLAFRWQGADRRALPRPFTRFSHRPHLTQPELRDCTSCHVVQTESISATYRGTNPHAFVSDFQPMSQQSCAACHQPHGAADRCTTCHNYHVGGLPAPSAGSALPTEPTP